jgi:RNA polymerase sigma-70 factor (ECF subfamily)
MNIKKHGKIRMGIASTNTLGNEYQLVEEKSKYIAECTRFPEFETIYNRFGNALYTYLLHQVADKDTAADLFQDVMYKIFSNLRKFQPSGSINAWLTVITRNHLYDYRRKKMRWKSLMFYKDLNEEISHSQARNNVLPFYDTEKDMEEKELQSEIHHAIMQLPPEQREVIDMHYHMQLSFREISEIFKCSINTVASRARYGLKKLKKILEDQS